MQLIQYLQECTVFTGFIDYISVKWNLHVKVSRFASSYRNFCKKTNITVDIKLMSWQYKTNNAKNIQKKSKEKTLGRSCRILTTNMFSVYSFKTYVKISCGDLQTWLQYSLILKKAHIRAFVGNSKTLVDTQRYC